MKLTHLAGSGCNGSNCPNIYQTESGSLVIQGNRVSNSGLDVPDNEVLTEIPRALLDELIKSGAFK